MVEDLELAILDREDFNKSESRIKVKDLEWANELVVFSKNEPTIDQIYNMERWVVARWMSDLLRNEEYKPDPDILKALIDRTLNTDIGTRPMVNPLVNSGSEISDEQGMIESHYLNYWQANAENLSDREDMNGDGVFMTISVRSESDNHPIFEVQKEEEYPLHKYNLADNIDNLEGYSGYDRDSLMILSNTLCERISGTQEGSEVATWVLDNLKHLKDYRYEQSAYPVLDPMIKAAGELNSETESFYTEFAQFISSAELLDSEQTSGLVEFTDKNGERVRLKRSFLKESIAYYGGDRSNHLDALTILATRPENSEIRNKLLGRIFGEQGPAAVLSLVRDMAQDTNLHSQDRENVAGLYRQLARGVVPETEGQVVTRNVEDLMEKIADNPRLMTESAEGANRLDLLPKILAEEGITKEDLIVEHACGTGWLTGGLAESGYKIVGFDMSEEFVNRSRARFPNARYEVGRMGERAKDEELRSAKAVVINGRSVHYLQQFDGFYQMMEANSQADVFIFDGLDSSTGAKHDRLANFWTSLENFDFDREWLEGYMWNSLRSIDNVHLTDAWVPPKEWWINMMGMHGYETRTVLEENYDGKGTNNIVYVSKRIEDPDERFKKMEDSYDFFMEIMSQQPKNRNSYRSSYPLKPVAYWREWAKSQN